MTLQKEPNPLVAVWMVTYNHERYIAQAIDSVLLQQINFNFILFIGEDCSTDRTGEICKDYALRYPDRIKLIAQKTNLGAFQNARCVDQACLESGAKYIAICEGDDYWTDPLKLQKQVDILEADPSVAMVYTDASTLTDGVLGEFYNREERPQGVFDMTEFIHHYQKLSVPTATSMLRSEAILFALGLLQKKANQVLQADYVLWYCAGKLGNYCFMEEKTAVYRMHGAGIMGTMSASRKWLESSMQLNHLLGDAIAPSYRTYAYASDWWYNLELAFFDLNEKKWGNSAKHMFRSLLAVGKSGKNNRIQILRDYFYRLRKALFHH